VCDRIAFEPTYSPTYIILSCPIRGAPGCMKKLSGPARFIQRDALKRRRTKGHRGRNLPQRRPGIHPSDVALGSTAPLGRETTPTRTCANAVPPSPDLGSCVGLFAVGSRLTAWTHEEGRDSRNFQWRPSRVVLPGLLVERAKAKILGISSGGWT
jgi:hypothetical protein